MPITDIPIFSMLRTRMQWHQERQRVLGRERRQCRHAELPARDLAPPNFGARRSQVASVALARTEPGHIAARPAAAIRVSPPTATSRYEVRPRGNAVNLEDEMMKVAANQMDYQAATALYTRSLGLIKIAHRQELSGTSESRVMDFIKSIAIAASGLRAQVGRMRVISENIANADSTAQTRRRRSVSAQDRDLPRPSSTARSMPTWSSSAASQADSSDFRIKHEPGHPAADANGNVKYPNVNSLVEMTDMREAQRSYEANLNVISATRRMIQRTLDILKAADRRAHGDTDRRRRQCLCRARRAWRDQTAEPRPRRRDAGASAPSFGAMLKDVIDAVSQTRRTSPTRRRRRWPPARPTWSTSSPRSPKPRSRSRRWSRCATR